MNPRGLPFIALAILTLWTSPPQALLLGMAVGLLVGHPYAKKGKKVSTLLLRVCVVLLGFKMNLTTVLAAGVGGFGMAAITIGCTFLLGAVVGRVLRVPPRTSLLITAGTAICGGSAIAAVGAVTEAEESEMTVAIATVFLLNAVALYLFPPLGRLLHLTQNAFGCWAGVAIHDISSVVGAASVYDSMVGPASVHGATALETATAVKLSRALWIAPMTLIISRFYRKKGSGAAAFPWFILYFLVASALRTLLPQMAPVVPYISSLALAGLSLTLFLIGSGLSIPMLRVVGWRTLAEGVILWVFISISSLTILLAVS